MLTRRQVVEAHLAKAKAALQARTDLLTSQKQDKKTRKRDVSYRRLEAVVRKYAKRIAAFDKVEAVKRDLEERRVERAAKASEPKVKKQKAKPEVKAKASSKPKKA